MSSPTNSRLRYIKDRCVNAYWMLRTGKFKLIVKSIYIELAHRAKIIQTMLTRPQPLDDSEVPDSAYINRRKVLPPSYRPTLAQPAIPLPPRADLNVIARDLKRIRSTIAVDKAPAHE